MLREEAFSPHVAIIPVSSLEEAVYVHDDTPYGLAMAVITEDSQVALCARQLRLRRGLCEPSEHRRGRCICPSAGSKPAATDTPARSAPLDAVTHKVAFYRRPYATEIKMAQGLAANEDLFSDGVRKRGFRTPHMGRKRPRDYFLRHGADPADPPDLPLQRDHARGFGDERFGATQVPDGVRSLWWLVPPHRATGSFPGSCGRKGRTLGCRASLPTTSLALLIPAGCASSG